MRPLVLFYLLVFYVLLQFSWWAYLLIELNKEVFRQKTELVTITNPESAIKEIPNFSEQLYKKGLMVAGEGLVFIAILIIGIFKIRQAFKKEFALARQQKNFLLSITHEFKSPLAAIKLNLQTLQKRELEKTLSASIISNSINETDRINNLIENALLAARIESHSFQLYKEEFNLTSCIESTIQSKLIPEKVSRKISLDLQDDVYFQGDALAISSLVLNLVENAEKYSPESSEIKVSLTTDKKHAIFKVEDQGIGIPDIEKPKIFHKFYRVGNEDTRKTKGTGLGLFIVCHIVNFHHGDIKVLDNTPTGTIFKVILPLYKN